MRFSLVLAVALGCGSEAGAPVHALPGVQVRFDLSGTGAFDDHPFPSDLTRDADGTLALETFPVPPGHPLAPLIRRYTELAGGARGATPNGAVLFAFDGPLDPASLPGSPRDTLDPGASVQLVDVDPASPARGTRVPLTMKFRPEAQTFGPANLLAVLPRPGFPLARSRLYAAVVTRDVRGADGAPLGSPLALEELKRGHVPESALGAVAAPLYASAFDALAASGVPRERVVAMTVFRTRDAVSEMLAIRDWYLANEPDPAPAAAPRLADVFDDYCVFESALEVPVFQSGTSPYLAGGGEITFDARGAPIVQRRERVSFLVTVPRGSAMPLAGWPVVLYEHGGDGTYREVVERGALPDVAPGSGPAQVLARRSLAAFGKDGATNVNRGNPSGSIGYFNFVNPVALRDNVRQSAFEQMAAVRLLRGLTLDTSACPGSAAAGSAARFDPAHFLFLGHSTGSTVGPIFVATEPGIEGAVFSGSGVSYIRQVLHKEQPIALAPLVRLLLAPDEELDDFRPFLTVLQTAWEEAEPLAYQPHLIREPLAGARSRAVLETFGIVDGYNPPPAENPALPAIGMDVVGPLLDDAVREELALADRSVLAAPVAGNVRGSGGEPVTAVAAQYRADPVTHEGHYVLFQLEEAKHRYGCFFESLARSGIATVPRAAADSRSPCEAPAGDRASERR